MLKETPLTDQRNHLQTKLAVRQGPALLLPQVDRRCDSEGIVIARIVVPRPSMSTARPSGSPYDGYGS